MPIYTKSGDRGETGIIGGRRLPKDDALIEAIGTVDELNAALGVVINRGSDPCEGQTLDNLLIEVQRDLFFIGSLLAGHTKHKGVTSCLSTIKKRVLKFEKEIDKLEKILPPLKNFILPGGTQTATFLHFARAVCRRAERRIVTLKNYPISQSTVDQLIKYFNRLSDYLFVLARSENFQKKVKEDIWKP